MRQSVISVVIPAYNEEKTIGSVIEETIMVMDSLQMPYEIIVVNDGSTDNTERIASTYKATVLSHDENRGKGCAVRRGFQQAQGDIIVTIDADGAHKPKEIPDLVEPLLNGTDIAAGSRFLGSCKYSTTKLNQLGNRMFNTTIAGLTGKRVTDSQTGFRAIKREVLEKLNLQSSGYEIETEITVKGLKNGFTFQEKPISCQRRKYSVSKLKILSDGIKIFKTILQANVTKIAH
jgi:glycosyltransferase involved in cell wall biosynthesis